VRVITKYFNSAKNLSDYQNGSFKLGTLEEYRQGELSNYNIGRMSDTEEGMLLRSFGRPDSEIEQLRMGGLTIQNCLSFGTRQGLTLTNELNDYVFCASQGPYEGEHHRRMRFGEVDLGYTGNTDLDAFAVINLDLFREGIYEWLLENGRNSQDRACSKVGICDRKVTYGDRRSLHEIPASGVIESDVDESIYLQAVFTKPKRFEVENEYRLTAVCDEIGVLGVGAKPVYPKSEKLKRSIVRIGHL
jgi:hypothetical protein